MIRVGTAYFVDYTAALRYYGDAATVQRKACDGEIHIGRKPPLKPGQFLTVIHDEGRYQINEPEA